MEISEKLVKDAIKSINESFEEYRNESDEVIENLKKAYKGLLGKYLSEVYGVKVLCEIPEYESRLGYLDECYFENYCWWLDRLGLNEEKVSDVCL